MPGNRKHDGGVEKNTIVIGAIRVLPVIVRVEQQIPADSLLKADVELIALPGLDRVLHIKSVLVDVVRGVEGEQASAAAQVERNQAGGEIRVGHQPEPAASRRVQQRVRSGCIAILIQADRVESKIGNAEAEILAQPCLLQINSEFPLVPAGGESHVAPDAPIE